MATRLKLGVDMDEVVSDFISAFHTEAEEVLKRQFPLFATTWGWDNWKFQPGELARVWDTIRGTEDWYYLRPNALPEVPQYLPWLTNAHDVYFITSRSETAGLCVKRQTEMYLSDIGVEFPTVLVQHDKGPIAAALHLDGFVDDKIENLQRVQECSPDTRIYLMDQVYNTDFKQPGDWTRVGCFRTFCERIEEFK